MHWFNDTPSFSKNTSAVLRTEGINCNGNLSIEALRDSLAILFLLSKRFQQLQGRHHLDSVTTCWRRENLRILRDDRVRASVSCYGKDYVVIG
jgi:hypothetical protein